MTRLVESSLECLPDAVLVCDADGILVAVNAAARRLLGEQVQPGRSVLGPDAPAVGGGRLTGDGPASHGLPLARALRGETVSDLRLVVKGAHGAMRHLSVTAVPVLDGEARTRGATAVLHEVPPQGTVELAPLQPQDGLERAAHRLRTTVTSIRGAVRLLHRALPTPVSASVEELLRLADRSTESLARQVDGLLACTRRRAG